MGQKSSFSPDDPDRIERFAVTVEAAVFTIRNGALHVVLLPRREQPSPARWALPGGFVRLGEDLHEAASRELAEQTGLTPHGDWYLEQLGSYGAPEPDPPMRTITVAYLAVAPSRPLLRADADTALATPVPVPSIDPEDLAFDHARIVRDGLERIRSLLEYTAFAARFLEPVFTTTELRGVYETVWGFPVHQGNFRRNIEQNGCFVRRPRPHRGERRGKGRPATQWFLRDAVRRDHPGALLSRALASRDRHGALLGIRTRPAAGGDSAADYAPLAGRPDRQS